ncbi:MAG TPA: hypothetical protein VN678_06785 [Acidobacteriaceae bacterium]|nr:hypothetical protein [Acidobacteriaceae bacterium]
MATTTQIAAPARITSPLALWHLLSLDAPTVAALWTWFIGRAAGVHLPAASLIAMALAVWILYAADRLLDSSALDSMDALPVRSMAMAEFEARHYFHHRHRRPFVVGIALASIALGGLLPLLDHAALRLYLVEGGLLIVWFLVVHATRSAHRLPKEIAVGVFFSAAVFIPTVARNPALRFALALPALLLGVLCGLNCLFIYAWEHTRTPSDRKGVAAPHPTTRFALQRLWVIATTEIVAAIALAAFNEGAPRLIAVACALSSAMLLWLHQSRRQCSQGRLSRIHLRAAADLALLTPALALAWLVFSSR